MDVRDDFTDSVGNTPLIRLRKVSELTGCDIYGKAEFLNPGGSVKDRAAKYIVLDAEARGDLKPGGVIVEGTAGNTGIGLALVGNSRGYRTVILMPETQSQEKKDMLRLCGAELRTVPAVPFKNPEHYVHQAERLAAELSASEECKARLGGAMEALRGAVVDRQVERTTVTWEHMLARLREQQARVAASNFQKLLLLHFLERSC